MAEFILRPDFKNYHRMNFEDEEGPDFINATMGSMILVI